MDLLPPTPIVLFTIFFSLCLNAAQWKRHYGWHGDKEPNACTVFLSLTFLCKLQHNVIEEQTGIPQLPIFTVQGTGLGKFGKESKKINKFTSSGKFVCGI